MKPTIPDPSNEMLSTKKYLIPELESMWVECRQSWSQLVLQIHLDL